MSESNSELRTDDPELDFDYIEISVADTGIGIKEEDMPKLFKEFSQLESPYSKKYEGTGLGLALTKRLIELHSGRIWVESEFGKGSTFTFIIPAGQDVKAEAVSSPAGRQEKTRGARRLALVIDDDPRAIEIVDSALSSEGYKVFKASNGKDGIDIAKKEKPDLIVLDLMMPGMSGFETLEILHSEEKTAGVPVLVLTAMSLSSQDRKRLEGSHVHIAEKGSLTREGFILEVRRIRSE